MANESEERETGDYGYSMHGMKGLARIVETYMRPSRALDDNPIDLGRKKIIFQACHAATEADMNDTNEAGDKIKIGVESVVSRLGKDLIENGVKSSVDIYGAPDGIQMHRNGRGVHYSGSFDTELGKRPHLNAKRVRIEKGRLKQQDVSDIPLWH